MVLQIAAGVTLGLLGFCVISFVATIAIGAVISLVCDK